MVEHTSVPSGGARSPGATVQELLDRDSHTVPVTLRQRSPVGVRRCPATVKATRGLSQIACPASCHRPSRQGSRIERWVRS